MIIYFDVLLFYSVFDCIYKVNSSNWMTLLGIKNLMVEVRISIIFRKST